MRKYRVAIAGATGAVGREMMKVLEEREFPVSELVRRLHISAPLMSWHLRRLTRAGIVRTERVGREVRCSFDREHFTQMQQRSFRALVNRVS